MTVCDNDSLRAYETGDTGVSSMLSRLIKQPAAHFRHQTRDEAPLSDDQKSEIAMDLYTRKPGVFLERFHHLLQWPEDRQNFLRFANTDNVVMHFVEKLDHESHNSISHFSVRKATKSASLIRNRRFRALELLENGVHLSGGQLSTDYFSHEAMRHREPILWEEMVGRQLSPETRRCYLGQEYSTFSGFLMNQMHEQQCSEELSTRLEQQRDSVGIQDDMPQHPGYVDPTGNKCDTGEINIPSLEKQFEEIMKLRFISRQDANFNYDEIDNDETLYDDLQSVYDAEEAYFDKD